MFKPKTTVVLCKLGWNVFFFPTHLFVFNFMYFFECIYAFDTPYTLTNIFILYFYTFTCAENYRVYTWKSFQQITFFQHRFRYIIILQRKVNWKSITIICRTNCVSKVAVTIGYYTEECENLMCYMNQTAYLTLNFLVYIALKMFLEK